MRKEKKCTLGRTEILRPDEVQFSPDYPASKISLDMDFRRLKKSIEHYGQLADILVREEDCKVIVVTGKRRLLAIQQLGLSGVRCTFVDGDIRLLPFIENNLRDKRTYMRLADEMSELKRKKQITNESFSELLGKSMVDISDMLMTIEFSDYIKEKIRDDERISFESLRYIIKKFNNNISRASALNDFINTLDNHVPSPSSRSKKRIKYVRCQEVKLVEEIETIASKLIYYLSDDAYTIENRAKVCRLFMKKMNAIVAILKEYKAVFPNVSIYERESRAKNKYEIEQSKRKRRLLSKRKQKSE